jgi:hypothetical protein
MKTALKIVGIVIACILLKKFCYRQTDGFALYKICTPSYYEGLEAPYDPEIANILDQPFYYLAKGAQSYVFASEDGKAVIKFPRVYHLRPPLWMDLLALPLPLQPYRVQKMIDKRGELETDFHSYEIAFEEMREETGLIYLHLNTTEHLKKRLTIYDKLGVAHTLDLDEMPFLLQRKATLVYPSIAHLVNTEGMPAAKEAISALVQLLILRCDKGIYDKDPDLNTNFGFLHNIPVQIDIGRFRMAPEQKPQRDEIIRITDNFRQWLDQNYPPLSEHLSREIQKISAFSPQAISTQLPFNPDWETRRITDEEQHEVATALSQPYRYLGAGGQCFSFVSKDDQYVIKFIKQKPFALAKAGKRDRTYQAFKLSFDMLSSETGLIYVHLNRTRHLQKTLPFEDVEGKTHLVALDEVPFAIQKKAELASSAIDRSMQEGNVENAKLAIDRILALNLKLFEKGFYNRDPNFRSNCGFIDTHAILIDFGRIAQGGKKSPKAVLKFREYLTTKHPELLAHYDEKIAYMDRTRPAL